jgi:hypothetical protein
VRHWKESATILHAKWMEAEARVSALEDANRELTRQVERAQAERDEAIRSIWSDA